MKFLCLSFLLLLSLSGCWREEATVDDGVSMDSSRVQIDDVKYSLMPGGLRQVSGRLVNPSAEPIRNAQIQLSLFDAHNRRISTMHIQVHDVAPGASKPFREPLDTDLDVRAVRVRSVLIL